jgi:SAM-dependent methyltransferase
VLEFGCGYGRLTRFLVQKVAASKVKVCDVIGEGARFCADEFGVRAIPATQEIQNFRAEPSDLVFFLSVHTHISERRLEALQAKLLQLLTMGGICFFTTMGLVSAGKLERYGARWASRKSEIAADLKERGVSFHPYGYYADPDYGMTWETHHHVTGMIRRLHGDSMRLLEFAQGAVDGHQDFYVYQRVS